MHQSDKLSPARRQFLNDVRRGFGAVAVKRMPNQYEWALMHGYVVELPNGRIEITGKGMERLK